MNNERGKGRYDTVPSLRLDGWCYIGYGKNDNQKDVSYYAKDGRLKAEPDGRRYEWRKRITAVNELGRTLTEDEMEKYRIDKEGMDKN